MYKMGCVFINVSGKGNEMLDSNINATRAENAAILQRFVKILTK